LIASEPTLAPVQEVTLIKEELIAPVEPEPVATTPEHLMPTLVVEEEPVVESTHIPEEPTVVHWQLGDTPDEPATTVPSSLQSIQPTDAVFMKAYAEPAASGHVSSGGYLSRPTNIYATPLTNVSPTTNEQPQPTSVPVTPVSEPVQVVKEEEELLELQMHIVEHTEEEQPKPLPVLETPQTPIVQTLTPELDEEAEQQRRTAERLQKLRNLSFNYNAADANNEFETVPAYIRRNMELYNSSHTVENFYSNYEVRSDEKNQVQLSRINTFLDGKRPD
jgi:cell division protein FtsZ